MRTALRIFTALWYLLGWVSHAYLGQFQPAIYQGMGETALIPAYTAFWRNFIMPNIAVFTLILAGFQITVGLLIIHKGIWVKAGLALSILFNLFLIQMGLSYRSTDPLQSFLWNRLPNIIFILIQLPLFWGNDHQTIPEIIQKRLQARSRPVASLPKRPGA